MARTGRNPVGVMKDALLGAKLGGWTGPIGADADHLKTPEDVDDHGGRRLHLLHHRPIRTTSTPTPTTTTRPTLQRTFRPGPRRGRMAPTLSRPVDRRWRPGTTIELDEQAMPPGGRQVRPGDQPRPRPGRSHQDPSASANGQRLRDRAERRRDRAADHPGRALHHRRPMHGSRDEARQPRPPVHRRLREGRRLQGGRRGPGERSLRRPLGDRRTARTLQAEPAFGVGQAVDVPEPGPGHPGAVPRQDGRDELPGSPPGRRPPR